MRSRSICSHHFHVPARELLLQIPRRCPYLPGLAMVGIAITGSEQHHVILELGSESAADRFYLGPTQEQVKQRARILARALQQLPGIDVFHASLVQSWVRDTWECLVDELVDQLVHSPGGSSRPTTARR